MLIVFIFYLDLLQVLSLVAMERPVSLSAEDIRDEKVFFFSFPFSPFFSSFLSSSSFVSLPSFCSICFISILLSFFLPFFPTFSFLFYRSFPYHTLLTILHPPPPPFPLSL